MLALIIKNTKLKIILLQLFISGLSFGQVNKPDSIYIKPQIPAEFIYGNEELNDFISNNIIVPFKARYYGINGEIILHFMIDTVGNVKDVTVIHENIDLGKALRLKEYANVEDYKGFFSNDSKRVVSLLSGLYKSAKNNGNNVNSAQEITINIKTPQYEDNLKVFETQKYDKLNHDYWWHFGTFTNENPDYPVLRYSTGVIKMQENKPEIACKYFEEAIRMNPEYIDSYYNLGVMYKKLQRINDACKMWNKASLLGDSESNSLIIKYCH
jgi:tetratricopeptide (TPR) repeat protein